MTWQKRVLDLILVTVLAIILILPFTVVLCILWLTEGRPLFYISERMQTPEKGFALVKLRTMRPALENTGVTGGDKGDRISPIYRILRKTRFDEVPQLVNVVCGQMSFVGPRPPLRTYVDRYPQIYKAVLHNRPGITGLASLKIHGYEERLLGETTTAEQTDHVYCTRCIPRKARLDLIYQQHQSLCLDLWVIAQTAAKILQR